MVKILFILVSASWKTQTFAVRGFHILHKQTLPHNRMHTPFHEEWHLRNPLHRLPPVYRPHTQPKKQNSRMRGVFTAYVSLSKFSCRASHEKKNTAFSSTSRFSKFIRFQILESAGQTSLFFVGVLMRVFIPNRHLRSVSGWCGRSTAPEGDGGFSEGGETGVWWKITTWAMKKKTGCLGFFFSGDYTTQLYRDYDKPLFQDPY